MAPPETTSALKREKRTLDSATLTSGAEQVIDFVLPLFAGAVLGLSAFQTGALLAATQFIAFALRPLAGSIVDRRDRTVIAALGSLGFAAACGLFAIATGFTLALVASLVAGAAGAFMWVAIRAIIGERLTEDSSVFAKLVAAEETGGWLILVPAIVVLSMTNYRIVFGGLALACVLAAALLVPGKPTAMRPVSSDASSDLTFRGVGTKLRPMLLAVVLTMTAEAAIGLLLLLHLQRGFGLEVIEVAYVFLPGAIAMSILPTYLHRVVVKVGRRQVLMVASIMSALFAVGLAFAPNPMWIAGMWILSAVAWSAIMPLQQAVIAEAVGQAHLGRGLSLYEAATLAGAFVGSLAAGLLYEAGTWVIACLVCAVIIAAGAALIPAAVGKLGVANYPAPAAEPTSLPRSIEPAPKPPKTREKIVRDLIAHALLYGIGVLIGWSLIDDFSLSMLSPVFLSTEWPHWGVWALRVWTIILIIDLIWSGYEYLRAATRR